MWWRYRGYKLFRILGRVPGHPPGSVGLRPYFCMREKKENRARRQCLLRRARAERRIGDPCVARWAEGIERVLCGTHINIFFYHILWLHASDTVLGAVHASVLKQAPTCFFLYDFLSLIPD